MKCLHSIKYIYIYTYRAFYEGGIGVSCKMIHGKLLLKITVKMKLFSNAILKVVSNCCLMPNKHFFYQLYHYEVNNDKKKFRSMTFNGIEIKEPPSA